MKNSRLGQFGVLVVAVLGGAVLLLISSRETRGGTSMPCSGTAPVCNGLCPQGQRCIAGVNDICFCSPVGCCETMQVPVFCYGNITESQCQNLVGQFIAGGACDLTGCQSPTPTVTTTATPSLPTPTGRPNGGGCVDRADCASGNCVDDVCCDTACNGALESCNQPGNVGTCASLAAAAPAASRHGVLLIMAVLFAVGAIAMLRRRAPR